MEPKGIFLSILLVIVIIAAFIICVKKMKLGEIDVFFFMSFAVLIVAIFCFANEFMPIDNDKDIERGRQLSTECKLVEMNMSDNTSRFNCNDIVVTVNTSDAKRFVEAYKKSLVN